MAVFTAIATAIVGAIGITGTLATIATAFVATGLALGTAKILGVMDAPKGQDPGVKIQLPPATDNKVPRLYGRNYAGGTIIDAEIKNQNKTMAYCVVLSDMSDLYNETWTINGIYRGDSQLYFSDYNVISQMDPNGTSSPNIANKIRVRVYAGGSGSAKQIFPAGSVANAYGGTSTSKTCQFVNWTSANAMTKLVFAIIEIDYDAENDLMGLGAFTFDISCNLTNPGLVLLDYLNNERYGMGNTNFPVSIVNSTPVPHNISSADLNEWITFAAANNTYINGGLSTFDTIKTNVSKICMSGGAFFTYNNKTGSFGVVVNRAASNAELANAFVLSDDNLVGALTVTSADLFSMYNQMEVEFPSVIQKDQTDTVFLETPAGQRNTNEPDNKLNVRFDLTNDREVAINLANIDLRQGRYTTVVTAKGDFTTLPLDVGDVVKLTNDTFNWTNKLFRVMQTKEVETVDSMLYNELTLLEYNANVYTWTDEAPSANINPPGINNFLVYNSNQGVQIGYIYVNDNPLGSSNSKIVNPDTGSIDGYATTANVISNAEISVGNASPFVAFPFYIPSNTTFDTIEVVYTGENSSCADVLANSVLVDRMSPASSTYFEPDQTYWYSRSIDDLRFRRGDVNFPGTTGDYDTNYYLNIKYVDSKTGVTSDFLDTSSVPVNISNTQDNKQVSQYGAGLQTENYDDTTGAIANSNVFTNIIAPVTYDIDGIDISNQFKLEAVATPGGTYTGLHQLGVRARANVTYHNAYGTVGTINYNPTGGVSATTASIIPFMTDSTVINLDPVYLNSLDPSFPIDATPRTANVWAEGYSTLSNVSQTRQFIDISASMLKLNKNEAIV